MKRRFTRRVVGPVLGKNKDGKPVMTANKGDVLECTEAEIKIHYGASVPADSTPEPVRKALQDSQITKPKDD